jgi:hypothetical protein
MTNALRILAAAALAAAGACGDDSGGGDGNGGPAFEDLPSLFAERLCPELTSCFDARTRDSIFGPDGCEGRVTAQLEDGEFAYVEDAIEAGRVEYDASQMEACLARLDGIGCELATVRVLHHETCERALTGSVELGGDCNVDAECVGVAFCRREGACPGTCSELLGPGEPCDEDDDCEDGLACPDDVGSCTALVEEAGDACGGGVAGNCRADLVCAGADEDLGTAGECKTRAEVFSGELGEPCDFDAAELCEVGLSCVVQSIAANGTPEVTCAEPVGSGDACQFGAPSPCPVDEYCDADIALGDINGTCMPLPEAGEPCAEVPGTPPCAPGLLCDVDNRCHARNRLGQPCASDDGCASGNCVVGMCERPEECEL